jgi:hypothetical protein
MRRQRIKSGHRKGCLPELDELLRSYPELRDIDPALAAKIEATERAEAREIEALKWQRRVAIATLVTTGVTLVTLIWSLTKDK